MTQRTHIDWFAFRTQAEPKDVEGALQRFYGRFGSHVALYPRRSGWQGYEQSADLRIADMNVGLVAYGGENQSGWVYVSVSGKGCEWVPDWDSAQEEVAQLEAFDLRRVDVALDTFKREMTHETVVEAYRAGMFTMGGRPPKMTRIEPEQVDEGRTIYVGTRERDKFARCYEKGLQLVAKEPSDVRPTHIDGIPVANIYRAELELKAKTAPLPTDLVDRRDQYFAGAYPYFQSVLSEVEPEIISIRRERGPQTDLAAILATIRQQYGSHIFTALTAYHGDIGAVMAKLCGAHHNEALLRAGVLLVDHE